MTEYLNDHPEVHRGQAVPPSIMPLSWPRP
jgi:hypothetical protein